VLRPCGAECCVAASPVSFCSFHSSTWHASSPDLTPLYCSLLGSTTLTFTLSPKASSEFLRSLFEPAPAKASATKKSARPEPLQQLWDSCGEPRAAQRVPRPFVHRLLSACQKPKGLACDGATRDFLVALQALITPDGPWKCPLARALVDGCSISLPNDPLTLRVHVYASRLAFELIACEHIKVVMERLTPPLPPVPVKPLPSYPRTLFSTSEPDDDPFTVNALLRSMEHGGYREAAQPAGVALQMFGYQKQALAWVQDQEARDGGLNAAFWETRQWAERDAPFFYMPLAGELRLSRPPLVHGGLISQQMGLGKTLLVCAAVVADKEASAAGGASAARATASKAAQKSRATLVVMPTSLLAQWQNEVLKSTKPGTLQVLCYPLAGSTESAMQALLSADVVLCSYKTLEEQGKGKGGKSSNSRLLRHIHWRRIVLDECQEVRSSTTVLARTAASLQAGKRWMVSGTPMRDGVQDLNGSLMFLGVWPFSLSDKSDGFWAQRIGRPWEQRNPESLVLLNALLAGVALRHSKSQRDAAGRPLAALPPTTYTLCPVSLTGSELYLYTFLERHAATVLSSAAASGFIGASEHASSGADFRRAMQVAASLLHLLRDGCTSPAMPRLLAPQGSAPAALASAVRSDATVVKHHLQTVDRLIRSALGGVLSAAGPADGADVVLVDSIAVLSAEAALAQLMRRQVVAGSAADQRAGLVRHGDGASGAAYDTGRT